MSELQRAIEIAYQAAKSGEWDRLLLEWENSADLARCCSRYSKPGSSWSFLHQAAYFGNEHACRVLIGLGASIDAQTHDALTPADIAAQKGHHELAAFLQNASIGAKNLWKAPSDPAALPSSNRWSEATEASATTELIVAYGGALVRIPKGSPYFTDSLNRILVGWHGTFNPPCGMDGESLLAGDE